MPVRSLAIALALLALPAGALAGKPVKGVISNKQPKHLADGRPAVTKATLNPKNDDFVLAVDYDKPPAAADCKGLCARSTFLIDTDGDSTTGLQQGPGKPPTGADLAVFVEGFDDLGAVKPEPYVRVVVRQFSDEDRTLEDGDVVQQLDARRDKERLTIKGNTTTAKIDASSTTIPSGKSCRFVFLNPNSKPIVTPCTGITREVRSSAAVSVSRGGSSGSRGGRNSGGSELPPTVKPGEAPVTRGGSAYDPKKIDPRWGEGG